MLEVAHGPVVASHSNARALREHPRNLPDDLLRAIAADRWRDWRDGRARASSRPEPATIAAWVDHLEHVVEVAGIEHVGIGADFIERVRELGGFSSSPPGAPTWGAELPPFEGMVGPPDLPALTAELQRRGFSEADLARIYHAKLLPRLPRPSSELTGYS